MSSHDDLDTLRIRTSRPLILRFLLCLVFGAACLSPVAAAGQSMTEGPGGPILVVADTGNPFGLYAAEILRTEGLNAFAVVDLSEVSALLLADYDVVILGETPLTSFQAGLFGDWVTGGGNLIAMRPDAQLAGLLGLTPAGGTLAEGYILIDTTSTAGRGLVGETIQFHGEADLYDLDGATALAALYADATTPTTNPALTLNAVGALGGQAAAFAYDLNASVILTRQGNPALVGLDRDGDSRVRPNDLFIGDNPGVDDWVDLDKVHIPQADEQQRLLANLIIEMSRDRVVLPRFWYFPQGHRAVVVMTCDDHNGGWTTGRFDQHLAESPPDCALEDWECVRATAYIYSGNPMTDAQAAAYTGQGFEVALHVNTGCTSWTDYAHLESMYAAQMAGFQAAYPSLPNPDGNRNHCVIWSDWLSNAQIESDYGIRIDNTYYYENTPAWNINGHPGMFTGSGLPMRFADLDGTMVDVFQSTTQMTDESGQSYPFTVDALLDRALGPDGYFGAFCCNMHSDYEVSNGSTQAPIIVASAQARGVPVISARQMLHWLDARNASSFASLAWSANTLTFDVVKDPGALNLEGMLPVLSATGTLVSLTFDGSPLAYLTETIKGVEYAIYTAEDGSYVAQYDEDTTPPVITNVAHSQTHYSTATITWQTDEPAASRVDCGVDSMLLDQSVTGGAYVTDHALDLTGLEASTVYYYRVTATDAWDNAATDPAAGEHVFFTLGMPCFVDEIVEDFAAGDTGSGTFVAEIGDGAVVLAPTVGEIFAGAALPPDWENVVADPNGTAVVGGGLLVLDGARAHPLATFAYPVADEVRTLEFKATYNTGIYQHAGFGLTFQEYPYAIFSTSGTGGAIFIHTRLDASTGLSESISSSYLGAPHTYRIEWRAGTVDYYIDGDHVGQHAYGITTDLRPVFFDRYTGAPTLDIDWVHMSDFSAAGSFESHVHGTGATSFWEAANWTADVPDGTTLELYVRTGDTLVPDGGWTPFTLLPASGAAIAINSQFIQYRADLSTSDVGLTPALEDIAISCLVGNDEVPPIITALTATPDPEGESATVTWETNEPADSWLDYGTDPEDLPLGVGETALVASHSLDLTGLDPGTIYYYRVTSTDEADNAATEPQLGEPAASFVTPVPPAPDCFVDDMTADFEAGSPDGDVAIAEYDDGELILMPAAGSDFGGDALPGGWYTYFNAGGSATVGGGVLTLNGGRVGPGSLYPPERSVEFRAIFRNVSNQHAGFGETYTELHWAMFSTRSGGALYARTRQDDTYTDESIGSGYFDAYHLYRADWYVDHVEYFVDDVPVASHPIAVTSDLRPLVNDSTADGTDLVVDWLRMTPYAAAGSFESRIYNAGAVADWDAAFWSGQEPAGTSLLLYYRAGDTGVPDGSWTPYTSLPVSGTVIGESSQFIQYRVDLATADTSVTPSLEEMHIACLIPADEIPPTITDLAAAPSPDGTSVTITWTTDEAADSRVDHDIIEAPLRLSVSDPALVTDHTIQVDGLIPGLTYYYRVTSADEAANPATEPPPAQPPATFVTPLPACAFDDVVADFEAGTGTGHLVANTYNGEVMLIPTEGSEFEGDSLPGGWSLYAQAPGGTAVVTGGQLVVDGARPGCDALYAPGRSVEFYGTFENVTNMHVGFGETFGELHWAIFSTGGSGTGLKARTRQDAVLFDTTLAAGYQGAPHLFRIDWQTTAVDFYIDGSPVAHHDISVTSSLRVLVSDTTVDSYALAVDWLRMTPYVAAASFESRIFDSGEMGYWDAIGWVGDEPAGTGITVLARAGETPTPDGSWTAYVSVPTSGQELPVTGRYLQYRADLTTADPAVTPALQQLSVMCGTAVSVPDQPDVPAVTVLRPNYPNPFNPRTTFSFGLARAGRVSLRLYAVDGRLVRTLVDGPLPAGYHDVTWDGTDEAGRRLASGAYFVRFVSADHIGTDRVMLIK
ncbi:fibronectin type III domain-containing protein [bacterium]|nr:fibronectin type III domain-containing protein [bacterium]